jgi:hypothetical protein
MLRPPDGPPAATGTAPGGPGSLVPHPPTAGARLVRELGPNILTEPLDPGRVADC